MMTRMILIDLQKVFDKIEHAMLLEILNAMVSQSILLIGLSLISPTDLFWLI